MIAAIFLAICVLKAFAGSTSIVIAAVAVVGPGGHDDEFVELFNLASTSVNITGWKLQYASATGLGYFNQLVIPTAIVPSGASLLITSRLYTGPLAGDFNFTAIQLSATAGRVRIGTPAVGTSITDANAVDTFGYGNTVTPEGAPFVPVPGSPGLPAFMVRRNRCVDTDNNLADFEIAATRTTTNYRNSASPVIVCPAPTTN